ncbi:activating transcription factor of chaperone isoform X2 [Scaptodrosophila lebanonensis]|uniref:Activating transcription factor of chaperone isoform X2 n=1 Tax=Drosophila lebanonensis TaxID=7225 RepID=A0A6J2TQM3_DROLE|nr:activating transcription factor of chaperone isoform X2 [Scaptodrosophila lebanonensis]
MNTTYMLHHAYECLLDQKLPQYIDYESNNLQTVIDVVGQPILPITKVQAASPIELYPGQYEAAAELAQLTPPQSPPQCSGSYQQPLRGDQIPLIYDRDSTAIPTAIPVVAANNYNFNSWPNNQATNVSPSNEIERESQLVDEIVKIRAQELQLPNWQQEDYNDDCESQLSSDASISFGDSSSITDEDWQPESSGSSPCYSSGHLHQQTSESAPASPVASSSSSSSSITSSTATKKRTRTYGRGVEDRKIRKKEQNKNAATRYRQKKKLEMEHVLSEEQELVQQNTKLMRKLSEGKRELKYLRQLIREFHKDQKQ